MAISIQEFAKEFADDFKGDVDAVFIAAVDGDKSAVALCGVENLGFDKTTIRLVDAVCVTIEENLKVAKVIRDMMKKDGVLTSHVVKRQETESCNEDVKDGANSKNPDDAIAKTLVEGIMKIIEREARKHEDDHWANAHLQLQGNARVNR